MRTNLPVTSNEVIVSDDMLIVSKTDLKGVITHVNRDFIEITGYVESELIGEPHNIVRHPDIPAAVFADLWATLEEKRPWIGNVKNRCKNGDYFWVEAHTTPLWEDDHVVGYMSVRRKLSGEEITATESDYRLMREKPQGGLRIQDGLVASAGALARLYRLVGRAGIAMKMTIASAIGVIAVMGAMSAFLGQRLGDSLEEQGITELSQNLKLIRGMIEVRAAAMSKEAVRLNGMFTSYFEDGFSLDGSAQSPLLKNGKTVLNERFIEPDRFTAATGAVASIFARQGDQLVRIATSLKQENGARAVAPLSREAPAYPRIMAGESYVGKTKLFGKDYYTSYSPIVGANNIVIGATAIGLDVSTEIDALKQHVKAAKVGQTGYFYVLDGSSGNEYGNLLVHPAKEGSNLLEAKDTNGREFIKEILEKRQGTIRYPWANSELGDTAVREKVVVFDTFPDWHWTIGGGTYSDEFEALSRAMRRFIWGATLIVVLVLLGGVGAI